MATTIQISYETKELLTHLKKTFGLETYDQAIRKLAARKTGSMAGALAEGKKYTVKQILENLRDKHD